MLNWKETFVVIAAIVHMTDGLLRCPPNFCANVKCRSEVTEEYCAGKGAALHEKSSICSCCDTCVIQIDEGKDCRSTMLVGFTAVSECAKGLICNPQTLRCQRVPGRKDDVVGGLCAKKQAEVDKKNDESKRRNGHGVFGAPQLKCTDTGDYEGKQCSGSQCYCVDKLGNNIGYSHYRWLTKDDITCECGRQKDKVKKSGLIGRMLSCDEYGNFKDVQCSGSICYCVERKSGKTLNTDGVPIGKLDSLNC